MDVNTYARMAGRAYVHTSIRTASRLDEPLRLHRANIRLQRAQLVNLALIVARYFCKAACNRWVEVCNGGATISADGGAGAFACGRTTGDTD